MKRAGRAIAAWWAVLLFAGIAVAVTVHAPYENGPPIRSDGLGYHTWTRALLDGDLSFCKYARTSSPSAVTHRQETGRCADKYAPGLALLRFPVMAPFTAANHGQLRSTAEDTVNQWCSIIAGVVAVGAMVATSRRLGARRLWANIAAAALAFGTGLFHYATYDSSFTHVYDAALLGLLLLVAVTYTRRREKPGPALLAATALLAFFVVATREPLVLVVGALGGTWFLRQAHAVGARAALRRHRAFLIAGVAGCGAALALQTAYNTYIFGRLTISAYENEGFSLHEWHQLDVVFSFQKGLITWYPIVLVVFACTLLARRWWSIAYFFAATVPLVLLYGAWHPWDLGGGFGHRGFVDIVPVYGVIFAVCLSRLRPRWVLLTVGAAALASVVLTLGLMNAYWSGQITFYGVTFAQWRHFGFLSGSLPRWLLSKLG